MEPKSTSGNGFPETQPMSLPPYGVEDDFPATVPQPLASTARPVPAPSSDFGGLSLAPLQASLYEAMALTRKDNRVCPQSARWLALYRILQEAAAGRKLPSPPLTGSAWASTPAMAKRQCLREQLEWADASGCLQAAYDFLKALPESDWFYG